MVSSDYVGRQLILEGIDRENIIESGIPVDTKFLMSYERAKLCTKFGIDRDTFTVLVVTGSFGIGPIEEIVDLLYREVQILVVCANNKTLYKRLTERKYPQAKVFGFINNIEELMAVSDIIITKPGGLTISECIVMDLPLIFITAIPGHEKQNIRALSREGIAIDARKFRPHRIKDIILDLKKNPEKLNTIRQGIRKFKKPDVLEELYRVIRQGSIGPGS